MGGTGKAYGFSDQKLKNIQNEATKSGKKEVDKKNPLIIRKKKSS